MLLEKIQVKIATADEKVNKLKFSLKEWCGMQNNTLHLPIPLILCSLDRRHPHALQSDLNKIQNINIYGFHFYTEMCNIFD